MPPGAGWRDRVPPELTAFLGFLILVFVAKMPVLHLPYYWDALGWIEAAQWLSEESLVRAFPGFRPADRFWGHPPGLHVLLAVLFKVFGRSRVVAHLLTVSFAFIGVYFTYRLGTLLYDRRAGVYAALALFLCPVYFAQSAMFLADVPVTALGVAAAYFALRKLYVGYLVCAIPLVLIKETGAAIVASLLLYRLLSERRNLRAALPELFRYGVPLLVIAGFIGWQKLVTGESFFIIAGTPFNFFDTGWGVWRSKFSVITHWLFWDQWRFVPSALILIGAAVQRRARRDLLLVALIVLAACYPFVFIYFLRRYLIPALPFLYVVAMGSLTLLVPSRRWQGAALAGILTLSVVSLTDRHLEGNGEWDMSYVSVVRTAQAMYSHLQAHHAEARVLTAWPDNVNLALPYVGYVEKPMKLSSLRGEPALPDFDVVLVSWPSGGHALRQYATRETARGVLRLEKRLERDGVFSELYVKTPAGKPLGE